MTDNQDPNEDILAISQKFHTATTIANVSSANSENRVTSQLRRPTNNISAEQCFQDSKSQHSQQLKDNVAVRSLPELDLPEKIILIIDVTRERDCTQFKLGTGATYMPMFMIKRVVEIFVNAKSTINPNHEFALVTLSIDSVKWICDFTNNVKTILNKLDTIKEQMLDETKMNFDLSQVFESVWDHTDFKTSNNADSLPAVTRVILIYSRSNCIPVFESGRNHFENLSENPYFILDSLFVHEPPSSDNVCEEVYEKLTALDATNLSYILEVGRNATKLHDNMAKLLAHPLQRPLQRNACYTINVSTAMDEVHTNV